MLSSKCPTDPVSPPVNRAALIWSQFFLFCQNPSPWMPGLVLCSSDLLLGQPNRNHAREGNLLLLFPCSWFQPTVRWFLWRGGISRKKAQVGGELQLRSSQLTWEPGTRKSKLEVSPNILILPGTHGLLGATPHPGWANPLWRQHPRLTQMYASLRCLIQSTR